MRRFSVSRTWRHLKRYNQIISVLIKYGFSDVVDAARKDLIARFGEPSKNLEPYLKINCLFVFNYRRRGRI